MCAKVREISEEFLNAFLDGNGHLHPLLKKVRSDPDLDLFIRDGYTNIYFKGASIIKLQGPSHNYRIGIHKAYRTGKAMLPQNSLEDASKVKEFIAALPLLKENITCLKSRGLEIEYEQLLIRSNNWHGAKAVHTEYFIVDRQYQMGEVFQDQNRTDMIGVYWPHIGRRIGQKVSPVLIEYKYGLNSDIKALHEQVRRYYDSAQAYWTKFVKDVQVMLTQRAKLGLFGEESAKVETLYVDEDPDNLQVLVVLADHNPFSQDLPKEELSHLPFADRIRIAYCGFALWQVNMKKMDFEQGA